MARSQIGSQIAEYDFVPDTCPICHCGIEPKIFQGSFAGFFDDDETELEVILQCTMRNCQRLFIARYNRPNRIYNGHLETGFIFSKALPEEIKTPAIDEQIQKLSPSFIKIYSQAHKAATYNLDEIAGVGYRKALEFLIKDYCIQLKKESDLGQVEEEKGIEEIKSSFLSNCIKNHVDDLRIKQCAERAIWLGNDETHYVRKWEEKDIKDLKVLIDLTLMWIKSSLLTNEYFKEMNNARK